MFDEIDEKLLEKLQNEYAQRLIAEKSKDVFRAIVFSPDGKGGVQGARLDFFYQDEDGRIAHEFFKIGENGELELVQKGIMPVRSSDIAEKAFKKLFLEAPS